MHRTEQKTYQTETPSDLTGERLEVQTLAILIPMLSLPALLEKNNWAKRIRLQKHSLPLRKYYWWVQRTNKKLACVKQNRRLTRWELQVIARAGDLK